MRYIKSFQREKVFEKIKNGDLTILPMDKIWNDL